jgi:hypothetical protein
MDLHRISSGCILIELNMKSISRSIIVRAYVIFNYSYGLRSNRLSSMDQCRLINIDRTFLV